MTWTWTVTFFDLAVTLMYTPIAVGTFDFQMCVFVRQYDDMVMLEGEQGRISFLKTKGFLNFFSTLNIF